MAADHRIEQLLDPDKVHQVVFRRPQDRAVVSAWGQTPSHVLRAKCRADFQHSCAVAIQLCFNFQSIHCFDSFFWALIKVSVGLYTKAYTPRQCDRQAAKLPQQNENVRCLQKAKMPSSCGKAGALSIRIDIHWGPVTAETRLSRDSNWTGGIAQVLSHVWPCRLHPEQFACFIQNP